jgi:uncharacterized membrane protein (DUF106 family)
MILGNNNMRLIVMIAGIVIGVIYLLNTTYIQDQVKMEVEKF